MQLLGRLEIKSKDKIMRFLGEEHVGRLSTVDDNGYPQIIPMNFVYVDGMVYMHSHTRGEKIDNIRKNRKAGFEADRELEFLPSYFEDPADASLADTLYISIVVKGAATLVADRAEKTLALNALMAKYQPEGRYEPVRPEMGVIDEVAIIKITPESLRGKYKIGQHLSRERRAALAGKIHARNSKGAAETLRIMGFAVEDGRLVMKDEPVW